MNRNRRDPWAELAGGVIAFLAVGAALVGVIVIVPVLIGIATMVVRAQDRVVAFFLGTAFEAFGQPIDTSGDGIRLVAAMIINAVVLMLVYFIFLVGTNLGTFLILGVAGIIIAAVLTALSGLREEADPADLLSRLDYWNRK